MAATQLASDVGQVDSLGIVAQAAFGEANGAADFREAAAPVTVVSMVMSPVTCLPLASNRGFSRPMSRLPASFESNAPSAASGVRPESANCDALPADELGVDLRSVAHQLRGGMQVGRGQATGCIVCGADCPLRPS